MITRFSGMHAPVRPPVQFKGLTDKPVRAAVSAAGLIASAVAMPLIHNPAVDLTTAAAATTAVVSVRGLKRNIPVVGHVIEKVGAGLGTVGGAAFAVKSGLSVDVLNTATGATMAYVSGRALMRDTSQAFRIPRAESPFKSALDASDDKVNRMIANSARKRAEKRARQMVENAQQNGQPQQPPHPDGPPDYDPTQTQRWTGGDSNGGQYD